MRVLLVHAHPLSGSLSAALRTAAERGLAAAGHTVDALDLYAEDFEARLSADERARYHDTATNVGPVATHVARLRAAEALVIIYPTWWNGLPAILKGWFDRVWLPGVAFDLPKDGRGRIVPLLGNIRRVAVVTTYGSPRLHTFLMGDSGRRTIGRVLLRLCHPSARLDWHGLYDMNRATPERCGAFVAKVERAMAKFG
ncbi:MAG: NAD(P)H-dependent oxidoreductase [Alphaproteobacteria bacterium]